MSSRKSSSSGEDLPSSRYVGRTPLRSLSNEIQCLSSSTSRFRAKVQLTAEAVKMTKGDKDPQSDSSSPTKLIQTSSPTADMMTTPASCGLEDETFKSFLCAGGEVEISNSSHCAEESIVLPQDQDTSNNDTKDAVICHSMIQSCSDHEEHPYFNPEMTELHPVDVGEPRVFEFPNAPSAVGDLDEKQATQDSRALQGDDGETNVTLKSFVCEGGEVEVSDNTRRQDDTIPLPSTGHSQDEAVDLTFFPDDCVQLCRVEHADHPYSAPENDAVSCNHSETTGGLTGVTFKSFNCTGGEIEIVDGTELADESVPLPECHTAITSMSHDSAVEPSTLCDEDLHDDEDHLDHPYCTIQNVSSPLCGSFTLEPVEVESLEMIDSQASQQDGTTSSSSITEGAEREKSDNIHFSEKTLPLLEDQFLVCQPVEAGGCVFVAVDQVKDVYEEPAGQPEKPEAASATDSSTNTEASLPHTSSDNDVVNSHVQEMQTYSPRHDSRAVLSAVHLVEISNGNHLAASAESPGPVEMQQCLENVSQVNSTKGCHESAGEKDSALGSSGNGLVQFNSEEKPLRVLKVLSEYPSALPLGLLTPIVRRMSLCILKACGDLPQDQLPADDSALEDEKSFLAPGSVHPAGLWAEHLESPMPCPLFNSTTLEKPRPRPVRELVEGVEEKCGAEPQSEVMKPVLDVPLFPEGPLQQQLRQMAEFLFLASGKMGPAPVGASAAATAPPVRAPSVESHGVSVGTSPVKMIDHSLNTSGQFERKREFSVVDSCTVTDPLLWNLSPGTLEGLPRWELEQRLMSSMMMVEALVQQLSAARSQQCVSAGCPPSDLREKLVQTDHTELSQTTMHRDLYLEALRKISELELDGKSLQNLMQQMQSMTINMTSLSSDTDAVLFNLKKIGGVITEDHQSLVTHYGHMMSLFEKSKETHMRLTQKVKEALQQRSDMRTQMEDAVTAKEAAFGAMDQLRKHCAAEISELEKSLGSQQELLAALKQICPEQVSLNQACTETLSSASHLLSQTMDDQLSLVDELTTVRSLLQRAAPVLLKLNEKAAAALSERDEHMFARDQAIEEREQLEGELNETHSSLQNAKEQIGDLNLQVTILTTETGVLLQKLNEKEEETGQLGRKVTELSATVSSTLASYTFLEQALAVESTKLQQSWQEIKDSKERGDQLATSLDQSEQRVRELTEALAQSDEQLARLQTLHQSQSAEIQRLQDRCTQLKGVRELNEFLLMENEVAREQVLESEATLRANLQSLRERNIECEDLRGEVRQLQLENRTLHEEVDTTRSRAGTTRQELKEKLAQAATDITLVLHRLRRLTDDLHATLSDQKPELQKDKASQPGGDVALHHPTNSFVSSIMMALTEEEEEDEEEGANTDTAATSGVPESQGDALFSETSAFTRIAAVAPTQGSDGVEEEEEEEEEEQSRVAALLSDLSSTVMELVTNLQLVQQRKDAELLQLHNTVCGLQGEHQAALTRHEEEVSKLKHQLSHLNHQMERGNQALQQKAQDEKMVIKLIADVEEAQEALNKYKTDNNDLRKDVSDLRRAVQQSKVESQFLREELRKAGGQPMHQTQFMEEKIQLLKEVERLKASLQEAEQARTKLLERAKRHQIIHQNNQQKSENELHMLNHMINRMRETLLSLPEVVKNCEQLQQLLEYIG